MKHLFMSLLLAAMAITAVAQEATDPNMARAEQMFTYMLNNNADSLYDNLSDQVKGMVQPAQFDGLLAKVEVMAGKYQSHEPWEVQEIMGKKAYVCLAQFEHQQLGLLVLFDDMGKMLGINLVDPAAIKKN